MNSNNMLSEIEEIPERAKECIEHLNQLVLPLQVPYLGMGSSYFAPLAFRYMDIPIFPALASEYHPYLINSLNSSTAVILSQSGKSSEALWCADRFEAYTAITNVTDSPLAVHSSCKKVVAIEAGPEHYSSSKTYINTLLTLFKGLGKNPVAAVQTIANKFNKYRDEGFALAGQVFDRLKAGEVNGLYIIGSGPNIATALQAALILSESVKIGFNGMAMAQYDHGPKETAEGSILIQVLSGGPSYQRAAKLSETVQRAGALVKVIEEKDLDEDFSILANIIPFNFMACRLAALLQAGEPFSVGSKITEVQ